MDTKNKDFYKFSESGIKKRNPELWTNINSHINSDLLTFKGKFYLYDNNIDTLPKCYCGNDVKFIDMKKGFREFCSKKCLYASKKVKNKRKKTNLKKYGVDNPSKSSEIKNKVKKTNRKKFGHDWATQNPNIIESTKKTNLEKYGVDNPSKLKEVRQKVKNTMLERYGVEHAMWSPIIKENLKEYFNDKYGEDNPLKLKETRNKIKNTMLERYGVEYALQNKDSISKLKKTNLEKYGSEFYVSTDYYKDKMKDYINDKNKLIVDDDRYTLKNSNNSEYGIKCSKCNDSFIIQRQLYRNRIERGEEICLICNPISKNTSIAEKEILNFIKSIYNGEILENYRIDNREMDIFIPSLKIGFEYNGLYWHSELNKNKNYHLDKTKFFEGMNINLIQIWEDDWGNKKDIVKSMINNKLSKSKRVFARKCEVREIKDNKLVRKFIENNHIQGFVGSRIKIGLFYENELVSIMTFGKLRKSLGQSKNDNVYELLRFCNKKGLSVIGGASKLFSYFKKNFIFDEVISYSLNSYSSGGVYPKMGFVISGDIKPNYFWCKNGIRNHRFNFRKDKLVSQGEDKNKTEKEIMYDRGYFRLFGCGSKKWIFKTKR